MLTLYLAGPIFNCNDAQCNNWRKHTKDRLPNWSILDPMDRDYRNEEHIRWHHIVRSDLADMAKATHMLAMAIKPSWGTAMEIRHFSMELYKPTIVVTGPPPISPWLFYHSIFLLDNLERAIARLKEIEHVCRTRKSYAF